MSTDITAVVNLHREGAAALPSVISAWRAVQDAQQSGLTCTLLLVLDRPDAATISVANKWATTYGGHILRSNAGDLGASRNAAVVAANSTWIAFLDADDLWGEYWLRLAHTAAIDDESPGPTAWHPAVNVIYGDYHSLLHHVSSDDPSFSWSRFRLHNQWTALSFVRRSDLLAMPFPPNELDAGFGFEDWSWNEEILRRGGRHRIVADSCHFIYRSEDPSLLSRSQQALRTRYPADPQQSYIKRPANHPSEQTTPASQRETHIIAEVEFTQSVVEQVRRAATIEPQILHTVRAEPRGPALPQNFQTHRSAAHDALDEIEALRASISTDTPIAQLFASSKKLLALPASAQVNVVAEVLLDSELATRSWGDSPFIDAAVDQHPQLDRFRD